MNGSHGGSMKSKAILLLSMFMLSACAQNTNLMLDGDGPRVFLNRVPDCEFRVIAHIQADGGYATRARLVKVLRQKAAEMGANALQVTYVQKIGASEYLGSARAIECLELEADS